MAEWANEQMSKWANEHQERQERQERQEGQERQERSEQRWSDYCTLTQIFGLHF